MHLLHLLQLLLLARVVTSSLISDSLTRDTGMATYMLYPKEPVDATSLAKTESLLKTQYGNAVESAKDEEMADTWIISSRRGYLETAMLMTSGVGRVVEITLDDQREALRRSGLLPRDVNQANHIEDEGPSATLQHVQEHSIARRDVSVYIALSQNETDVAKTEEFLKTKIEGGVGLFKIFRDEDIIAWGNLTLTENAKSEVESYEGIRAIQKAREVTFNRALPAIDEQPQTRKGLESPKRKNDYCLERLHGRNFSPQTMPC
jgi:hypothetical protein